MTIHGEGGEELLDSYDAERHPVARKVIGFTDALTRVGTLRGIARVLRNAIARTVGKMRAVDHKLVEEVNVSYGGSPAVLRTRPRHTKIVAGRRCRQAGAGCRPGRQCAGTDHLPRHTGRRLRRRRRRPGPPSFRPDR